MRSSAGVRRLLGVQHGLTPAEAEDRLRHLVEGNADLEEDEREMIASVIELGEQPVREVMVPRIDIVAAPASSTVRDVLDRIVESGHSRIPIYDGSIDNVTGVVYAKDLLSVLARRQPDRAGAAAGARALLRARNQKGRRAAARDAARAAYTWRSWSTSTAARPA